MLNDMYLHTLLLFYKQIYIQHRAKAVYFLHHFDANNSIECSPVSVKTMQIILR